MCTSERSALPGEAGSQNGPEALLAFMKGGLRGANLGQVEHRPDHAHGLALAVANHMPAVEHLSKGAVRTQEAVLVGPGRATAIDHHMYRRIDARAVIRVNVGDPPVAGGFDGDQRVAIGLLQRIVPQYVVGFQVPVPDGVVGCLGRPRSNFLFPQC